MKRTLNTAGRTVLFSSITGCRRAGLADGLPQRFLYRWGSAGRSWRSWRPVIALTVLPAVLALLGNRVNAGRPSSCSGEAERDATETESGFWYRLSRFVMRRPIRSRP